jgi:FkbM family methyltransferase
MNYHVDNEFYKLVNIIDSKNDDELSEFAIENFKLKDEGHKKFVESHLALFPYWGEINLENSIFKGIQLRAEALKAHLPDMLWLYKRVGNYRSKSMLSAYLSSSLMISPNEMTNSHDLVFEEYFDLDFFTFNSNEVVADCGAYVADTIRWYRYCIGDFSKYYAYEILPEHCAIIRDYISQFNLENLILRPFGVADKNSRFTIKENSASSSGSCIEQDGTGRAVKTVKIDDDIFEPITFLKMDVEGAEMGALRGAKKQITKNMPKLAISLYHNHTDLYDIPRLVDEFRSDYKFSLQFKGHGYWPTEMTLLATDSDLEADAIRGEIVAPPSSPSFTFFTERRSRRGRRH